MNIKAMLYTAQAAIVKNLPSILTGMAVVGTITTTIFAIQATNEAKYILEDKLFEKFNEELNNELYADNKQTTEAKLTKKEVVKYAWKCYIPTAISACTTIACIVGANCVSLRRQAAIAGLYSLSEASLKDYKEKVAETIGKEKAKKMQAEVKEEKVKASPPKDGQVIMTGYGSTLCWDTLSDRYFKSDLETLRRIQNDLNHRLLSEMWISLNELYEEIGLKDIKLGYDLGWSVDHPIDMRFDAVLTPSGEPCLCLDYEIGPVSGTGWRD